MTDIAKTIRPWLTDRFIIGRPTVREAQVSSYGTRKWLLAAADGQEYEMVFIPDAVRGQLCVQSQDGYTFHCRFFHPGTNTLFPNPGPAEIVGQLLPPPHELCERPTGHHAGLT